MLPLRDTPQSPPSFPSHLQSQTVGKQPVARENQNQFDGKVKNENKKVVVKGPEHGLGVWLSGKVLA
jgi:hypothetical protein